MLSNKFLLLILLIFSTSFDSGKLELGMPMPEAKTLLTDISGKEITLESAVLENGLLVMFTCNTCPYVLKNQSRTIEVCRLAQKKNIGVVLLNSNEASRKGADSYEQMKDYAKNQGFEWMYAVDKNSALADAFDANRTPECFLFNNSQLLVYHGAIDDNPQDAAQVSRKHLAIAVEELAAGRPVSIPETKSVGCGIKRMN
jgi:cytochrome oxidase Cu insertion factor (SCO1/SenC/PrrC family)